jgi:hypothetical protein
MKKPYRHSLGISFWTGGAVISIINIIKILAHTNLLRYDYIMIVVAVTGIALSLILLRIKKRGDNKVQGNKYIYGISFWIGGGVYSFINMIMNLKNAAPGNILYYNYLMTGVAVFGLILNIILLKKRKSK